MPGMLDHFRAQSNPMVSPAAAVFDNERPRFRALIAPARLAKEK